MPAEQRGHPEKLKSGLWVLRYYDAAGKRQRARTPGGKVMRFKTKTVALKHYRDVIGPRLRGEQSTVEYTLAEFVLVFLERHIARDRTIQALRERLAYATRHPAPRVRDDDERGRGVVRNAPGAVAIRDHAGAAAVPRRRGAVAAHGEQSRSGGGYE